MNTPENKGLRRVAVFAAMAALLGCMVFAYALLGPSGPEGGPGEEMPDGGFAVDVNTADAATLQLLPGVGPALADRIIAERTTRPFTDTADLSRVSGIGPRTAERIGPYAKFSVPPGIGHE